MKKHLLVILSALLLWSVQLWAEPAANTKDKDKNMGL